MKLAITPIIWCQKRFRNSTCLLPKNENVPQKVGQIQKVVPDGKQKKKNNAM